MSLKNEDLTGIQLLLCSSSGSSSTELGSSMTMRFHKESLVQVRFGYGNFSSDSSSTKSKSSGLFNQKSIIENLRKTMKII